jgi:type III secretion protein R
VTGGTAALLAVLAVVPLIVLTLTSFVKLSVVLSLVRNAIGAPDAPSGLVVTGLSLLLTLFVMAPVVRDMIVAADTGAAVKQGATGTGSGAGSGSGVTLEGAVKDLLPAEDAPKVEAAERAVGPLRVFLARHAGDKEKATFGELAGKLGHPSGEDELWTVAPAFVTTELREAFAIAVLVFVPFLVIDLVVSLALAALGLHATQPQVVALPLKLLLFVAVDGWRLLLDALLRGYA